MCPILAAASSAGHTIIYAATTAERFRNAFSLLRSTDLGLTWSPVAALVVPGVNLTNVVALDSDPVRLIVAVESLAWPRSSDGGASWQALEVACPGRPESRLPSNIEVHTLLAWGPAVYAGTDEGLYASEDGGDCWTQQGELRDASTATRSCPEFRGSPIKSWR